ncbi:Lactonase, 7-bladed beta-propeller [Corynebacterium mustelae]|uniref:Lactonase, 7-bladed beta-propeller n=1 Tax=Corynebacterium mustelae TaxID=571915 RepID=A0A0G3H488_9CORY|nr:Lactonase, 7-bladed beta-propeller [Corynebacterium mustelae]
MALSVQLLVWKIVKAKILLTCSLGILLTACNPPSVEEKLPEAMGNATPAVSPADSDPEGTVISLAEKYSKVEDLERIGDVIAIRATDTVALGTLDAFKKSEPQIVTIDPACSDMTGGNATDEFIFACPDGVYALSPSTKSGEKLTQLFAADFPLSTAVKTRSGDIVAGASDRTELLVIDPSGTATSLTVDDPTDQLLAVANGDKPDAVYRINRTATVIQNINVDQRTLGAKLRVGLGVGTIAGGENGMAIAADAIGNQFGIYLADDVIRLQQTTPTHGQSPWTAAWDQKNQLVWVATTSDNQIRSYSISAGTGEETATFASASNVHALTVMPDGVVVAASESGDGLQVISP